MMIIIVLFLQYSAYMASRFLLMILTVMCVIVGVQGWCEKTHFFETNRINEVDFSPDRSMFTTSGSSKLMIVWNFTSLQPIFTLTCSSTVQSAKFSKNQQYIAVGLQGSGNVNIIQVSTFTSVFSISTTLSAVYEVDFSWDNSRILICGANAIEVYAVGGSWTRQVATPNGGNSFMSCKFQKNNQYFGGDSTGKNNVYNTITNSLLWSDSQGGSSVAVDFDMVNQSLIVATSGGNKFLIYPSARWPSGGGTSQNLNKSTSTSGNSANSVAFAKQGSIYAVGVSNYLLIYENNTNNLLFNWSNTGSVTAGTFSYDSQYFISGSSTGLLKVFKRNCQACPSGTYEISTKCSPCASAMAGCLTCANSSYCYTCGDGYAVDSTNKNCTLCHNTITGCVLCNTTAICTACSSFYYLSGTSCTSCQTISNCLTCSSSSVCLQCNSNFYVDSTTHLCVACTASNCLSCYNSSSCLECIMGYYVSPNTSTCLRCPQANCTDCSSSTVCTQCIQTYYLTGTSTCASCSANCLVCTSTSCTRCVISYYPSATNCLPCSNPCASCTSSSSCSTCVPGYFHSAGSCTACSGSCLTCTSSTACLSCNVNYYYLSASNTCNKCQNLMTGCLQCTNTTCLKCESGYYYDGTSCLKCSISSGCQTCLSSTFCMSCLNGYQLDSATGVCSLCGVGCSSCSSSSVCINCLPKYYFSSGSCLQCPATCPTCLSASSCLSCVSGYYVSGTQTCLTCKGSINNCTSCTSSTYCTSCELGYRLSATNTSCIRCTWPCSLCNATQCTECSTGYYLSTGACTICGLTCSSCSSSSFCTSCINGFYLTGTNTCTSCQSLSAGCSTCTQTTCISCLSNLGYYLSSGSCSLCTSISNCLQCQNSTICTTCSFGYYANSGSCSACSALVGNCQSCTSTACLTCMDPYFLSASACQLCSQGCSACSSAAICKTCLTGYLLQTGVCTYCDTLMNGCEACTSATVCINCADGYIVSGTSCASCSSLMTGCQLCSATNICSTCMDQYYLSGSSCVSCSMIIGCGQCNSSSVCLSCQTGYFQSATNTCSRCSDAMCITCTASTTCVTCLSGYFVSSGSCTQCSSSFPGCVLCNSTQCLQCKSGYYINSANQCSNCLVNGCEICNMLQPTLCVTCSSLYYLNASSNCVSCSSSMSGCINCLSSTHCLKCMVGSYLTATFTCQSCFSLFNGCGECSATSCTACQGGYVINGGVCSTCISFIPGCLYCTSSSVCLSCQSGYYQSGNTCLPCSGIAGCLDCSSAAACNLCSDSYYLNTANNLCQICNSTITGCISCASSTTCRACLGNYALSGGICTALKSTSSQPYTELRLVTEYMNKDNLLHRLIVRGTFNTQTAVNLTQSSTITMVGGSGSSVQLVIYSYQWVSQYEVNFITNNPIGSNFSSFFKSMPSARLLPQSNRLLASSVNLNYQFKLDMTESAIQSILPTADHTGSLSLSNPADNPSFIRSVYTQLPYNYHYFGLVVTLLMLVIYFVKAAVSVPQSDDQGELISHVFLLRCGGLIFSLTYMEYMDYCYGFLSPDLPWLNLVTTPLAASADLSPNSYLLFYSNMTLASSYLSALCLIAGIILVLLLVAAFSRDRREGVKVVGMFLYNFFEVGLIMAGSMSIQGAYYNNLNYITSNSLFYLVGIVLFVVVAMVNVWMAVGSIHRINKIRILVKTTFLSLLYVSPVYLLPIVMGLELIFVVAEYNIKKAAKLHPHLWLINQLIINLALVTLVLLSDSMLSVYLPSVLIVAALSVDMFIHIREYRHQQQLVKVKEIQKLTMMMETQEKLNRTVKKRNNIIYEQTKMNETAFSSSNFSQDVLFNTQDEDAASSKSPLHNNPQQRKSSHEDVGSVKSPIRQKRKASYIFDEASEAKYF